MISTTLRLISFLVGICLAFSNAFAHDSSKEICEALLTASAFSRLAKAAVSDQVLNLEDLERTIRLEFPNNPLSDRAVTPVTVAYREAFYKILLELNADSWKVAVTNIKFWLAEAHSERLRVEAAIQRTQRELTFSPPESFVTEPIEAPQILERKRGESWLVLKVPGKRLLIFKNTKQFDVHLQFDLNFPPVIAADPNSGVRLVLSPKPEPGERVESEYYSYQLHLSQKNLGKSLPLPHLLPMELNRSMDRHLKTRLWQTQIATAHYVWSDLRGNGGRIPLSKSNPGAHKTFADATGVAAVNWHNQKYRARVEDRGLLVRKRESEKWSDFQRIKLNRKFINIRQYGFLAEDLRLLVWMHDEANRQILIFDLFSQDPVSTIDLPPEIGRTKVQWRSLPENNWQAIVTSTNRNDQTTTHLYTTH